MGGLEVPIITAIIGAGSEIHKGQQQKKAASDHNKQVGNLNAQNEGDFNNVLQQLFGGTQEFKGEARSFGEKDYRKNTQDYEPANKDMRGAFSIWEGGEKRWLRAKDEVVQKQADLLSGETKLGGIRGGAYGDVYKALEQLSPIFAKGTADQLGAVRSGFQDASGQLDKVGQASRNQIARSTAEASSRAQSQQQRQGLLSTSADFSRGSQGDNSASLARLGEALAGMRAGLSERRGMAEGTIIGQGAAAQAGAQQSLSSLLLDRAKHFSDIQTGRVNSRLQLPFSMSGPSSGDIFASSLFQGVGAGIGTGLQGGWIKPGPYGKTKTETELPPMEDGF